MKDFYNEKLEAVGICKVCSKGISKENLIEGKNGIVCKQGECSKELKKINEIIEFNSINIRKYKNGSVNLVTSLFTAILGLGFLGFGVYSFIIEGYIDYFSLMFGALFLGFGIYKYFYGKSIIKESK